MKRARGKKEEKWNILAERTFKSRCMHGGLRVCRKAMALAVSRANPTRRSNERSGADERIPLEDNEECRNIAKRQSA